MNVQGDEPLIPTANIDQIIELLKENSKNHIVTSLRTDSRQGGIFQSRRG